MSDAGTISRRRLLRLVGAAAVVSLGPACGSSDEEGEAAPPPRFFTDAERRAIGALANVVLPPEPGAPGGAELGAAPFIERLLTAFDVSPPALFADGPYSDRNPIPDGKGSTTGAVPPNDFVRFRPIDRVTERAWRILIHGSRATEGGTINEGIVAPVVGLRDLFKQGISAAMASSSKPLEDLSFDEIRDVFDALDRSLQDAFIELVPQAAFGAPEYGGNPGLAGWALAHFPGDDQPFGYSIFDERTGAYYERLDRPITKADPGPDPAPIDEGTRELLAQVVAFAGGKVFP